MASPAAASAAASTAKLTRLDKLIQLLDVGATSTIRQAAGMQIAQLACSASPNTLVARVRPLLRSSNWDTRIAAGWALEAIGRTLPQWDPSDLSSTHPVSADDNSNRDMEADLMKFDSFDILKVIRSGVPLLGSSASELDSLEAAHSLEEVEHRRHALMRRLGLAVDSHLRNMIDDKDLGISIPSASSVSTPSARLRSVTTVSIPSTPRSRVNTMPSSLSTTSSNSLLDEPSLEGLSARERNHMKRKLKRAVKTGKIPPVISTDRVKIKNTLSTEPPVKKIKTDSISNSTNQDNFEMSTELSDEQVYTTEIKSEPLDLPAAPVIIKFKGEMPNEEVNDKTLDDSITATWPFQELCAELMLDLFDARWECRHGAAIGLREAMKTQGSGAGKTLDRDKEANLLAHHRVIEDLSIRLLCVFALDRFGDYIGDSVVAPVRETCAQALAAVLTCADDEHIVKIHDNLLRLLEYAYKGVRGKQFWEAKHACLLGLKYVLAVHKNMVPRLLPLSFAAIVRGIQDPDDDVRTVSSSALLPVTDQLTIVLPTMLPTLVSVLWDALLNLDDLTASTSTVMDLFASLSNYPEICAIMIDPSSSTSTSNTFVSLASVIHRVCPFFRHTIPLVRLSVLRVVASFLEASLASQIFPTPQTWWISHKLIRHIIQNYMLEERADIIQSTTKTWHLLLRYLAKFNAVRPHFDPILSRLMALAMSPIGTPLDQQLMAEADETDETHAISGVNVKTNATETSKSSTYQQKSNSHLQNERVDINAAMMRQDLSLVSFENIMRGRMALATALGHVWRHWPTDDLQPLIDITMNYLRSPYALHKQLIAIVMEKYFILCADETDKLIPDDTLNNAVCTFMLSYVETALNEVFGELTTVWHRLRRDSEILAEDILGLNLSLDVLPMSRDSNGSFSLETVQEMISGDLDIALSRTANSANTAMQSRIAILHERLQSISSSASYFITTQNALNSRVSAAFACALISHGQLPHKLNPIVRSVMSSIKCEEIMEVQEHAASSVAQLIKLCHDRLSFSQQRSSHGVVDKLIQNLCILLCSDPATTPLISTNTQCDAILSLKLLDQSNSTISTLEFEKRRGRKSKQNTSDAAAATSSSDISTATEIAAIFEDYSGYNSEHSTVLQEYQVTVRGATAALRHMCYLFTSDLFTCAPKLWSCVFEPLHGLYHEPAIAISENKMEQNQGGIDALQIIDWLASFGCKEITDAMMPLLPLVTAASRDHYAVIREMAARAFASLASSSTSSTMRYLIEHVVPFLSDINMVSNRQGATEVIFQVIRRLGTSILPYVIFLIVPLMGRMSDQDESVRKVATYCFAALVKLVPLEEGIPDPPEFTSEMVQQKNAERQFLMQLLDNSKLEEYRIPVKVKAELRKYQHDGVNWIMFLNRYKLHGALCDDMGLGKTLQTICAMVSDHCERALLYAEHALPEHRHFPSLVVCPSTLTSHWHHEIAKYTDNLTSLVYMGPVTDRVRVQSSFENFDVVITSYEVLRNDIDSLSLFHWNYCILDEGHIIRNSKTKITQATKALLCNHRLILSGTPIQNSPLELWSLFDFLMPGFLGTEQQFNNRFGKPILASRDAKKSSIEQELGTHALKALHRQVLPFLLRRLKEDVLHDLPPKIIQDYYCELSPLQIELYEEFSRSQFTSIQGVLASQTEGDEESKDDKNSDDKKQKKGVHVFQALQYLRKLCNHPLLVLSPSHPKYAEFSKRIPKPGDTPNSSSAKHNLSYAPKLQALKQLLNDCGIGLADEGKAGISDTQDSLIGSIASQHRVLIFCQLKGMLDIIESELFKPVMPSVSYIRLDSTISADKRHGIVTKFNDDPSIDVLLLTTHVGGLGLNLTSADTVIFVEHDWNPMKDLQAMDRAHRLGQKKVVSVYRLITKGTLEEKIMGLQRFKSNIANQVVTQQNSSLSTMDTGQVLDLFSLSTEKDEKRGSLNTAKSSSGRAAALEGLSELWDETQYEEYDVANFLGSLK